MNKFGKVFSVLFFSIGFTFFAWLITWGILFGYIGVLLLFVFAILGIWINLDFKKIILFSFIVFFVGMAMLPLSIKQYNARSKDYFQRIQEKKSLSFSEKISIYGLNIFFCTGGSLIYPEVAGESMLMLIKDSDGVREFESDFFLKSHEIQRALKEPFSTPRKKIKWNPGNYKLFHPESRYALALNPCEVYPPLKNGRSTEYKISVDVSYPYSSEIFLIDNQFVQLRVQEGLFHYLQKEGWLHPYRAVWKANKIVPLGDDCS